MKPISKWRPCEHDGRTFYDVNQTARSPSLSTNDKLPIFDEIRVARGKPNNTKADAHAEVGAMGQAYFNGVRGGSAKLTIIGQDACTFCVSDVKRMALRLELDELTVVQPKGTTKFANPQEFAPLRKGGKSW